MSRAFGEIRLLGEAIRSAQARIYRVADAAETLGMDRMAGEIIDAIESVAGAYEHYRDAESKKLDEEFQESQRQVARTLEILVRNCEAEADKEPTS